MIIVEISDLNIKLINKIKRSETQSPITIGSVFKNKRSELHMTLDEVCKDICCVALLSRLERNQVTSMNKTIMNKLCERLDLGYENILSMNDNNEIIDSLKDYIEGNINSLKERHERLNSNVLLASNALCSCLYFLISEDYKQFDEYINKLDCLKSSMSIIEMSTLLLLLIQYYNKTYQYKKALKYIDLENQLNCDDRNIKILLAESKMKISCALRLDTIDEDYLNIKKYYDYSYPFKKQYLLKLDYLQTMDPIEALATIEAMEKEKLTSCLKNFYYTKAYIYLENRMFKECINLIIDKNLNGYDVICLYAYSLNELIKSKEEDDNLIEKYKQYLHTALNSSKYRNEYNIHLAFVKLMQFELDEEQDTVIFNFLKTQIIPIFDDFYFELYSKYCFKRYYYLIGKLNKYKDAYVLLKKYID